MRIARNTLSASVRGPGITCRSASVTTSISPDRPGRVKDIPDMPDASRTAIVTGAYPPAHGVYVAIKAAVEGITHVPAK